MVAFCQLDNGSGGVSNANQAFPDWMNDNVYSWKDPNGAAGTLLKNLRSDGSLVSSSPVATVLGISGNTHIKDHSATIINGFMYIVTTNNFGIGNIKLSKINLSTLSEISTLVIVLFGVGGISADDFSIIAKTVGGTDYLAILLNNSANNPNFEIVNAATMTSVVTGQYPHGNGFTMLANGPVVSTIWTMYAWAWEGFANPSLVSMAFNTSGNTLTPATIKTYVPSDFVGPPVAWDEFDDFANFCYDASDGHLICQGNGGQSDWGSILFNVFKVHSGTGAILWNTIAAEPVGDEYGSVQASFNDLTDGTYVYMDYLARLYKINTSDGSVVGGFPYHTQHFAGGSVAWAWNSTDDVLVYQNDGDFQDTFGYSIFRPDEAPTQRWTLAPSSGEPSFQNVYPYRDPANWDAMYQFRTTHDDEGTLPTSGYELLKVDLKTGAQLAGSPVWQFSDVGNPFRTIMNGAETAAATNVVGASGGNFLYMIMRDTNSGVDIAMFQFDKATLNVTAASAPFSLPGTINSYVSFTCVSPDEAYVVNPYFLLTTHTNSVAIWTGDLSSFAFIDLSSIGITSGDEVHQNAVFDSDGFLWLTTKTVTPGTYNPAIAQSKLWKLSVSAGPALAVVTNYTIPDNFQSFGNAQFAGSIFNYNITYNPITNKITLLYNYSYPLSGQQRNVALDFDIGSTTFGTPLDWGPEDGVVVTAPPWNETDLIASCTGPSTFANAVVSVIDLSTNPPTKVDTAVTPEWALPFRTFDINAPFPGNAIYYSQGSDYFYLTGTGNISFDETYGFMDAILLPATAPDEDIDLEGVEASGEVGEFTIEITPPPGPPILPAYPYVQYNDDDDILAFFGAYNEYAQAFSDWFAALHLPVYTSDPISGTLLDWVAKGLYGMARPSISFSNQDFIGPLNTWACNEIGYNYELFIGEENLQAVDDDVFRRILTWHIQKSYGKVFNIRWLKRRIVQFLRGINGVPFNVDQTYEVSVTFGPNYQVFINFSGGTWSNISGAILNFFAMNEVAYNQIEATFTPNTSTLDGELLKAAIQSGALELPFQFTYIVNL